MIGALGSVLAEYPINVFLQNVSLWLALFNNLCISVMITAGDWLVCKTLHGAPVGKVDVARLKDTHRNLDNRIPQIVHVPHQV